MNQPARFSLASLGARALLAQCRRLLPALVALYLPVGAVLGGLFLFWFVTGRDVAVLTRDPMSVVETELLKIQEHPEAGIHALADLYIPLYAGAVSNLGILLWTSAATVCFFAWRRCRRSVVGTAPSFFLLAGVLGSILMLDDLFLLHERVLPYYFGLDEKVLFVIYLAFIGYYLARFRADLMSSDFVLLALAFGWFAVSLAVDLLEGLLPLSHLLEDGAKFAGIATWNAYYWRTALQRMP